VLQGISQAEHARWGGFHLLEDPLTCHGELCVAEGTLESDGDVLTAVGGFVPPSAFEKKQSRDLSGLYEVVALAGFFGKDKRWTVTPPDAAKFTVEEGSVSNKPCLFVAVEVFTIFLLVQFHSCYFMCFCVYLCCFSYSHRSCNW
jgi:hypothetical protein